MGIGPNPQSPIPNPQSNDLKIYNFKVIIFEKILFISYLLISGSSLYIYKFNSCVFGQIIFNSINCFTLNKKYLFLLYLSKYLFYLNNL